MKTIREIEKGDIIRTPRIGNCIVICIREDNSYSGVWYAFLMNEKMNWEEYFLDDLEKFINDTENEDFEIIGHSDKICF